MPIETGESRIVEIRPGVFQPQHKVVVGILWWKAERWVPYIQRGTYDDYPVEVYSVEEAQKVIEHVRQQESFRPRVVGEDVQ
jgi:hypothetical protein